MGVLRRIAVLLPITLLVISALTKLSPGPNKLWIGAHRLERHRWRALYKLWTGPGECYALCSRPLLGSHFSWWLSLSLSA